MATGSNDAASAKPAHTADDGQAFDAVLRDIAAAAAAHDLDSSFPHDAFAALHGLGLMGLPVPVAAGGQGGGLAEAARVVERVGHADPSVALSLSQHFLMHAALVSDAWPHAVRDAVRRSALHDGGLINALRVEPELGTPARGGMFRTFAQRLPGGAGWSLSGHKIYSTGIPGLTWLAVWARTDAPEPEIGVFIVAASTPGWRVEETWDHLGMRATASHDVHFDNVCIPLDHAVDLRPAQGWAKFDPIMGAWNSLLIAAVYHGVALASRDWLVTYLNERVPTNLGAPLASLPRFQMAVGDIEVLLHTSDALLRSAANEVDHSDGEALVTAAKRTNLAKLTVTNNAVKAVEIGLSLVGNPGLSRHNALERHYRNVLCSRIHIPQDDMILGVAGRSALDNAGPDRT